MPATGPPPARPPLPLERRALRRTLLLAPALAPERASCETGCLPLSPAPPGLWLAVPAEDSTRRGGAELDPESGSTVVATLSPPGLWRAATAEDSTKKAGAELDPESDSTAVPTPGDPDQLVDSEDLDDWGVGEARAPPPERLAAPGARRDDGEVLPAPPGLAPPPETPSHGSTLHALGRCRPCNWFWKPGGCNFGAGCSCCHLCPAEEPKLRRKAKRALIPSGPRGGEPTAHRAHPW